MSRSFGSKVVAFAAAIALVSWFGVCSYARADASLPDGTADDDVFVTVVPEPSTAVLTGLGLAGLALLRRFTKR